MNNKINLKSLELYEIENILNDFGEQKFRAKQIFQWIQRGITNFDEMTNISKELRTKLSNVSYIDTPTIAEKFDSKVDETIKYIIKLTDGNIIESVLMKYEHGYTICISSQIGCRMGCRFCASTLKGLRRNLEASEMLSQVALVSKDIGQRISNIVIMGIGEPFDNYDNVLKFLRLVNNKEGLNIGYRHITISTCGLVPGIRRLAGEGLPVTLAISLHAPNDELRKKIMPIANKYSINEILDACKLFIDKTTRRVTFEYSMISGVNDSKEHAEELTQRLRNLLCHVNLIPINKIEERDFEKSKKDTIKTFQKILRSNGIEATIRRELGSDINASCGQLRNRYLDK